MVVDDVFAVIAEQTRRNILASLGEGDKAVGQLVEELDASQPTVSKHLRVLREAELVTMRADGQKRYYSLNPEPLRRVLTWLESLDGVREREKTAESSVPASIPDTAAGLDTAVVLAAAAAVHSAEDGTRPQQLGRTVGRAAKGAADLLANLPKFGRRRE